MSTADSTSEQLKARGQDSWNRATNHPMVQEIAAGTLPHEKFRRYFEQNILYLEDYSRSIGLALAQAPDHAALDVLSRFLAQIVHEELPANHKFLLRLGGDPSTLDPRDMNSVTYGYTRHLLNVTRSETCAAGLAAILPCQWSYGALARPLMEDLPTDPIYADWISLFGNDEYDSLVSETTGLLDRLVVSANRSLEHLSWVFDVSTKYESQFWTAAYEGGGWSL